MTSSDSSEKSDRPDRERSAACSRKGHLRKRLQIPKSFLKDTTRSSAGVTRENEFKNSYQKTNFEDANLKSVYRLTDDESISSADKAKNVPKGSKATGKEKKRIAFYQKIGEDKPLFQSVYRLTNEESISSTENSPVPPGKNSRLVSQENKKKNYHYKREENNYCAKSVYRLADEGSISSSENFVSAPVSGVRNCSENARKIFEHKIGSDKRNFQNDYNVTDLESLSSVDTANSPQRDTRSNGSESERKKFNYGNESKERHRKSDSLLSDEESLSSSDISSNAPKVKEDGGRICERNKGKILGYKTENEKVLPKSIYRQLDTGSVSSEENSDIVVRNSNGVGKTGGKNKDWDNNNSSGFGSRKFKTLYPLTDEESVSLSSVENSVNEKNNRSEIVKRCSEKIFNEKVTKKPTNLKYTDAGSVSSGTSSGLISVSSGAVSASSSISSFGSGSFQFSRKFFRKSTARSTNRKCSVILDNDIKSEKEEFPAECQTSSVHSDDRECPKEWTVSENELESDESDRDDVNSKKASFYLIRGSDPRIATCRGKLQNKRSKLNQEINKELRLRAGAENLFKATTNRKLKETVALELSFVNSNLQLLKEQLAELNSSVEIYQGESPEPVMPMIPLGLKETKDIDFREPFKDFILEHYSEDGASYESAITEFMDIRQAMRTPNRDNSGIALLFQYYNQLYFVERRFFPPDRSLGIYFEWYDSLTGVPSCQKTVAFEKACVLFNMAAVYTQMGAKQDRLTEKGLDQAVDSFLRAAGTYTYIQENFTNAPSMDLAPQMLDMLVHLMLAQARECLFEKLELQSEENRNVDVWLDLAQESAQLAQVYETVYSLITMASVREYVPYSWVSLVQVKQQHYAGLAHFHSAVALLSKTLAQLSERSKDMLHYLHVEPDHKTPSHIQLENEQQRKQLGKAHLKSALQLHEESQRLQRMCRELRNKKALSRVLARTFNNVAETLADTEEEDTFSEILEAPCIQPSTKFQLSLTPPDFAHLPVEDLFRQLGPVAIFSAKHHWTAPRSVRLQRASSHDVGFGFSVRGDSPVIVAAVDQGSLAHFGGMKEGDFIVAIGNCDVKWSQHDHVVKLIKEAGDSLSLKLVTPMDRNYLKPKTKSSQSENSNGTGTGNSSNSGTGTQGNSPVGSVNTHKKLTWNPFKKHRERETSFNLISR